MTTASASVIQARSLRSRLILSALEPGTSRSIEDAARRRRLMDGCGEVFTSQGVRDFTARRTHSSSFFFEDPSSFRTRTSASFVVPSIHHDSAGSLLDIKTRWPSSEADRGAAHGFHSGGGSSKGSRRKSGTVPATVTDRVASRSQSGTCPCRSSAPGREQPWTAWRRALV